MSMSIEKDYDLLKSARWTSFLECTALGLQLNLTIISAAGNPLFQSSRLCSACQKPFEDFVSVPDLEFEGSEDIQETLDLKTKGSALTFPLGNGLIMVTQECSCNNDVGDPSLKDRSSIGAKLVSNFLTSFKYEYSNGQRAVELSILRQMNYIVLSLFHGDKEALKRSLELILSALIIILEAEGSWVQFENGKTDLFIKGDESLVKAYLTEQEGSAQQVDISYGQYKCNLGVLTPFDKEQASELIDLMAQECSIILEIDNLFRLLNNQLASVLGGVNSAIFLIDQRKNVTYLNKATEKLFHKSLSNLVGNSMSNIDGPWVSVINAGIAFSVNGQMEALKKDQDDDDFCWIDWQVAPIFEDADIMGWLVIVDDRSDYYRWQCAARRADRFATTSMMLGTLAHELRNPLSAAKGLLQLMTRKRNLEQTEGYVDLVLRELDRVTRLLNEFLLLGKPASISQESLDLVTFIEELLPLLDGETNGTDTQVIFNTEEVAPVSADSGQITQVMLNLVRNAIQSVNGTGIVEISIHQVLDKVEVRIQDNGPGFAPGVIDQLFTPFFSTKERGTGLGLAIVKAIIHNHDGDIVANNVPQGGALFTFTLPVASTESGKVDIALIFNNKVLSYSLEKALNVLDYDVKVLKISDLEEVAVSNINVVPKLVIFEGVQDTTIEGINAKCPEIKIIALRDCPQENAKDLKQKGIKVLARPFEITRIISTIKRFK